jgi:hypothetical protein
MTFQAQNFQPASSRSRSPGLVDLLTTVASLKANQDRTRQSRDNQRLQSFTTLANTAAQAANQRGFERFKREMDTQALLSSISATNPELAEQFKNSGQFIDPQVTRSTFGETLPSTQAKTRSTNFNTFKNAAEFVGGGAEAEALGESAVDAAKGAGLNFGGGNIFVGGPNLRPPANQGQGSSGTRNVEQPIQTGPSSFSAGASTSVPSSTSGVTGSGSRFAGVRKAGASADKAAQDAIAKERDNNIIGGSGIGIVQPEGETLQGIDNGIYITTTADGRQTALPSSTFINQKRREYDAMSNEKRTEFNQKTNDAVSGTRILVGAYRNLDDLFAIAESEGKDPDAITSRVRRAFANDDLSPNLAQAIAQAGDDDAKISAILNNLETPFVDGSNRERDSVAGLFRNDPVEVEMAKQFARIKLLTLELARQANGGRPTDKDLLQVAGNFGSSLDSADSIRRYGKNAVGMFGQKALDGSITNRQSEQFNQLAGDVSAFVGEEYQFGRNLGSQLPADIRNRLTRIRKGEQQLQNFQPAIGGNSGFTPINFERDTIEFTD